MNLLRSVNKNECLNSPDGLQGIDRRFVEYNGGMGESQLRWLEGVLQKASNDQEKVIIFGKMKLSANEEIVLQTFFSGQQAKYLYLLNTNPTL